jgi:hypothetical protein
MMLFNNWGMDESCPLIAIKKVGHKIVLLSHANLGLRGCRDDVVSD